MTVVLEKRLARFKVVEKIFQSRQEKNHTVCIVRQGKERKGKENKTEKCGSKTRLQ
jgi:hypothetical protein